MDAEGLRDLAQHRVLSSLAERSSGRGFDWELWNDMASLGLLGLAIEAENGGSGEGVREFVRHLSILAAEGCDLGLALSVADHVMLCAYPLQAFGSPALRERYLPSLCRGRRIGAAAVSEPGSGGDPARMATTAVKENGTYILEGSKEPITNGPVAELFLVIASTDPKAGKEGLTALMVEKDTGVRVEEMSLGFLPTSPHGRVMLEGARVPEGNVLGEEGWGHTRISRSLFLWERAAIIPVIVAFLERLHHLLVSDLDPSCCPPDLRVRLARGKVELTAYRVLSERLLELAFEGREGGRERVELLLFFGKSLPEWVESMRRAWGEARLPVDETAAAMLGDLRLLEVGSSMLDWQFRNLMS